jgi:hypothetical protein
MFYFDDDEDWFEEEDLLTNFDDSKLIIYEEAIKRSGENHLFISDKAFDCKGRPLSGRHSLRTKDRQDETRFWKIFREVEKKYLKS